MKSRRNLSAAGLVIVAAACGGAVSSTAPELRVAIEERPKILDPRYAGGAYGQRISRHLLFDSLVRHGDGLELVPQLAERWEQPDERSYVFYLRRDVRFHDGEPFDAGDVVFTFEHLLDPSTGSPFAAALGKISTVEALDAHTVRFTLHEPYAAFLTSIFVSILPEHLLSEANDFARTLVGTGPFRFVSQSPNDVVLAANEDYFAGGPGVDRLVFKVVGDESTRLLKARRGEIDLLINALPEHQLKAFDEPPLSTVYRVAEAPGVSYNYLGLNHADPLLGSAEVRRAIAYGIDVDEIIAHRLHGHAGRASGLLSAANPFYEGDVPVYGYDPAEARRRLDAAGFPDPDGPGPEPRLTLEIKTSNSARAVGNARILQAQLAQVGVRLEIRSYEWGTFYGDVTRGNFQLTLMRWVGVVEPDFYYDIFHSSQIPPQGRNRGRYANPEMDRLVEAGRVELDLERRREIYSAVQKLAAVDLPYLSLWHPHNVSVVHRRIRGYRQHPKAGLFSLKDIVLDEG